MSDDIAHCPSKESVAEVIQFQPTVDALPLDGVDFGSRDVFVTPFAGITDDDFATPAVKSRGWGTQIFVCYSQQREQPYTGLAVSGSKHAHCYALIDSYLAWIDGVIATLLIILALIGLFAGWLKRRLISLKRVRFSLRQALWFFLLFGLACCWWLPIGWQTIEGFQTNLQFSQQKNDLDSLKRFHALEPPINDYFEHGWEKDVDFDKFDIVMLRYVPGESRFVEPKICRRAQGWLFLAVPGKVREPSDGYTLFAAKKAARVVVMSATQANLLDGGVFLTLVALAIASFFVGRKRPAAVATTNQLPL